MINTNNVVLNEGWALHPPFEFDYSNLKDLMVKDVSRKLVELKFPEMKPLLKHLFSLLPVKRFQLVDAFYLDFANHKKTCKNSDWHLDGKMLSSNMEHYAIWADGEYLTKFMIDTITVDKDLIEAAQGFSRFSFFKETLQSDFKNDEIGFELPVKTPISYTTYDFHKGRDIKSEIGFRFFVRVMSTDNIRPKNILKFKV